MPGVRFAGEDVSIVKSIPSGVRSGSAERNAALVSHSLGQEVSTDSRSLRTCGIPTPSDNKILDNPLSLSRSDDLELAVHNEARVWRRPMLDYESFRRPLVEWRPFIWLRHLRGRRKNSPTDSRVFGPRIQRSGMRGSSPRAPRHRKSACSSAQAPRVVAAVAASRQAREKHVREAMRLDAL